jgi:GMP synthase (glutamine-hydrolysing) A subunit
MQHEIILILDFGSQYTQLIARRFRELGVKTIIVRGDLAAERIDEYDSIGLVLSGGPASVFEADAIRPDPEVFNLDLPVLGICYGMHLMSHLLGGTVEGSDRREYGLAELEVIAEHPFVAETPIRQPVWMSHGDSVTVLPDGFEIIARTANTPIAAIAHRGRRYVGLQFHPEVHHNVGGLPERLGLELIEPLRDLFKDEVRRLGEELGLPHEFVWRHPFPGPGLAVRILGPVHADRVRTLQNADAIVIDEIRGAGLYDDISQALCVLLPVRSVGVMGDQRTYDEVLAIRAVTTEDFMTADWFRFPPDLLDHNRAQGGQRDPGDQPRCLRCHLQAAGNH